MSLIANWSYPTAVRFGNGRINELAQACKSAGMAKPLVVTDRGLAKLPLVETVREALASGGLASALFSDVDPNPTDANLEAGLDAYRRGAHDGVIALGGGSGLDLGKLIAFMHGQTRPVWDFEDIGDWWTRADPDVIAPIVAVPTTAGTGSEVGRAGVLTNSHSRIKKIIFHPKMLPAVVICDPELTVGMPPFITAGTGMDAFIHSLEAYSSPVYHPMSHGIALEGMRLVNDNLLRAYRNGGDLEARGHMMSDAAMGATAFQKGLGAMHALSHPVGANYDTHHGTTNAVVMLSVLEFNRAAIEERIERLAAYLDIDGGFDGFVTHLRELNESLGIPSTLGNLGVKSADWELLASQAIEDPSAGTNPVPLTKDAALSIYESLI